jgi:two-component response regulator (ARR-A family)
MATLATLATETQFHVLAVDDSLIDRKLIERLLKTSSYQGKLMSNPKGIYWIVYYFGL